MNTITKIENALKAINQAGFQTLINHLLHLQGYKFINAPGSVVGKEKTSKGTPDSLFLLNDDKYVFVECTTQERLGSSKTFFEKLSKDIEHCFKEEATSIEKDKIEKIILACNEKISAKEYNKLRVKVKSINPETNLEILNIQNLPMLIFDIPKLADEHLNIQMIKGEIYNLTQFLSKTEKGLQPKLSNEFIGRESELDNCVESLKEYDILLLSGASGVGKTKLAIKILEEFSKDDYIPIVIQSSGVSLWDDYKHLFTSGKNHIILFDDANNSVTNLNYMLSRLEGNNTFSAKLIITSRDYVKKEVTASLENYRFKEFNIPEFKDEEIEKIIVSVLPNLRNHIDIKHKIVELAKGNARISLMATYSVTEDSETNYLNTPELLYEKYFKKISAEIRIFQDSIVLKSLAIVSFFGVLDRQNEELENLISSNFGINWNDLWSAIIELHNNEIVNIHSNQIVKVSDQVLATYSLYKCFIDEKSAVLDYAEWINIFIDKFSERIRATLIDINNTFTYNHVKDFVQPHLKKLLLRLDSEEKEYAFYNLFWFYKGRDCLLYVKKWIKKLPQEVLPEKLTFTDDNNAHHRATKHFELLKNFWNHPNELLKPSLQLTLALLQKQPARLTEILKHLNVDFRYKLEDRTKGYYRQNILLDILFQEEASEFEKLLKNGIFLHVAKDWLGWHYTECKPAKGNAFTIYNFDLYKCDQLLKFRARILNKVYNLFDSKNETISGILQKIIRPGGNIDKNIYIQELPIFEQFASNKLDTSQYEHCQFISIIAKFISEAGGEYPESWNKFLESDIIKLDAFLHPSWQYKKGQSHRESQDEKRKEFDEFVKTNDWKHIEKLLLNANDLHKQQLHNKGWHIGSALTDIYVSIARKNKFEFLNALRLLFGGKVIFNLQTYVLNIVLLENILTGQEILNLMREFEFKGKPYWQTVLLYYLPEEQINENFLKLLLDHFENSRDIYNVCMLDYLKYNGAFLKYQQKNAQFSNHNIISYLTTIKY